MERVVALIVNVVTLVLVIGLAATWPNKEVQPPPPPRGLREVVALESIATSLRSMAGTGVTTPVRLKFEHSVSVIQDVDMLPSPEVEVVNKEPKRRKN